MIILLLDSAEYGHEASFMNIHLSAVGHRANLVECFKQMMHSFDGKNYAMNTSVEEKGAVK